MSGMDFEAATQRIRDETSAKHIGVARVNVDVLEFPHSRSLNPKNVARLKGLFHGQRGFRPDDLENRIPAVITDATVDELLNASGLPRAALAAPSQDYPKLNFPTGLRLECLRGQHRVKAAKEAFPHSPVYWAVDLFLAGISVEAKQDLIEAYASERKPEDGEIYYKIRRYQGKFGDEPNPHFEHRWRGRLAALSEDGSNSPTKRLKHLSDHPKFGPAFDAFHTIPALYCGLRISVVDKMTGLRCDEVRIYASYNEAPLTCQELLSYLDHIRCFWSRVLDDDQGNLKKLDAASIRALELHAPGACEAEASKLRDRVRNGEIFGGFDAEERQVLWSNVCSETVDCLVPSLLGFFDDLKHIKLAADCMKRLVHLEEGATLRSALSRSFAQRDQDNDTCVIQTGTLSFRTIQCPKESQFDVAYRVLWLYALREHDEMPAEIKKKLAGASKGRLNERILFDFAFLAAKLGFRTKKIEDLLREDPDRQIARRLLLTARGPDCFRYQNLEGYVTDIEKMIKSARAIQTSAPDNRQDTEGGVRQPQKSGAPKWEDARRDKPFLFLDNLHAGYGNESTLTSLFIFRSTYFAFFGKTLGVDVTNSDGMHEERLSTYMSDLAQSGNADQDMCGEAQPDSPSPKTTHMSAEEVDQKNRLENLSRQLDAQGAHLRDRQEIAVQLESAIAEKGARLEAARQEDEELQAKLKELKEAETEQVIRLESLNTDEKKRQTMITALKQTQNNLGEEIRLDKIATIQKHQALQDEGDKREAKLRLLSDQESQKSETLAQLDEQITERRAILAQLIATEGEKQSLANRLTAEEQKLQVVIQELEENARRRRALEKTEGDRWNTKTEEAKSIVNQLAEREGELRAQIAELQANVDRLAEEEKELQSRIERSRLIEKVNQSFLEPLTTTAEQISFTESEKSWTSSVSSAKSAAEASHGPTATSPQDDHAQPAPGKGLESIIRAGLNSEQNLPSQDVQPEGETTKSQAGESTDERTSQNVQIKFQTLRGGEWRDTDVIPVSRDDPSQIQRVAGKYVRKGFGIFDQQGRALTPQRCFERVTSDGSNVIRLTRQWAIKTDGAGQQARQRPRLRKNSLPEKENETANVPAQRGSQI